MRIPHVISTRDFYFNDFPFSEYLIVENIKRTVIDSQTTWIELPEKKGLIPAHTKLKSKEIIVRCRIIREKWQNVEKTLSFLAMHLITNEPKALLLRDSDLYDMAMFTGKIDVEKINSTGLIVITFINPSGERYGDKEVIHFTSTSELTLFNLGTSEANFAINATIEANEAKITNKNNNRFLRFIEITPGEALKFETTNRSIENRNARKGLTLSSRFFTLSPGGTTLKFEGLSGTITWSHTWI